jgi:hypothetical protein
LVLVSSPARSLPASTRQSKAARAAVNVGDPGPLHQ